MCCRFDDNCSRGRTVARWLSRKYQLKSRSDLDCRLTYRIVILRMKVVVDVIVWAGGVGVLTMVLVTVLENRKVSNRLEELDGSIC